NPAARAMHFQLLGLSDPGQGAARPRRQIMDSPYEPGWRPWPVSWSGIWIGALSALAVGLIIGLIGYAMGAHQFTAPRTTTWRNVRVLTMIFNIGGAFFAFVVGGWFLGPPHRARRPAPRG